jgi:hypothetical protein
MFVYTQWTHPDAGYMECYGPFDTLDELKQHVQHTFGFVEVTYGPSDIRKEPRQLFGNGNGYVDLNDEDFCLMIFELPHK